MPKTVAPIFQGAILIRIMYRNFNERICHLDIGLYAISQTPMLAHNEDNKPTTSGSA